MGEHGDDASVESMVSTVRLGAFCDKTFARGQLEKSWRQLYVAPFWFISRFENISHLVEVGASSRRAPAHLVHRPEYAC